MACVACSLYTCYSLRFKCDRFVLMQEKKQICLRSAPLFILLFLPTIIHAQESLGRTATGSLVKHSAYRAAGSQTDRQTVLSGTVVDPSGSVISGATVLVRSVNGAVQRTTKSDSNGSFAISGLPAGRYRLLVSNPGLESKELFVTIAGAGESTSLRIVLALGAVSTTVKCSGPRG